jgi:hypothetical protein
MILPYHGQLTVLQGMTLQRPATLYLQVCQLSDPAPANKEPVHLPPEIDSLVHQFQLSLWPGIRTQLKSVST